MKLFYATLLVILMSVTQTGCMSSGGRLVIGPLSYIHDSGITQDVKISAMARQQKDPAIKLMEVSPTDDGRGAKVMFDLSKMDGWDKMTFWSKVKYVGSCVGDAVIEGIAIKKAYDTIKDKNNEDSEHMTREYANDRDTMTVDNTGAGNIHLDYAVPAGSPKPDNFYVSNSGSGSVDVDIQERDPVK